MAVAMGSHCVAVPILVYFLLGIESEVHWGYDLDFDPWPYRETESLDGLLPVFWGIRASFVDAVTPRQETGIIITATDVRNTKPHIDWQVGRWFKQA